LVGWLVR